MGNEGLRKEILPAYKIVEDKGMRYLVVRRQGGRGEGGHEDILKRRISTIPSVAMGADSVRVVEGHIWVQLLDNSSIREILLEVKKPVKTERRPPAK